MTNEYYTHPYIHINMYYMTCVIVCGGRQEGFKASMLEQLKNIIFKILAVLETF